MSQFMPTVSAPVSGCKLKYMKFYQNMRKCFLLGRPSTLERVAWRDCRDSIPKDTQNPKAHSPVASILPDPM